LEEIAFYNRRGLVWPFRCPQELTLSLLSRFVCRSFPLVGLNFPNSSEELLTPSSEEVSFSQYSYALGTKSHVSAGFRP